MKNLTIRAKITLWFSVLVILLTTIMFSLMFVISNSVLDDDVKETLADVVADNANEIEFIDDINSQEMEVGDQYLQYKDAYIEIDDDYLNESSGVYCALYDADGNLIYGENTINAKVSTDKGIKKYTYNNEHYYVMCKALSGEKLDGLTLVGIINENANETTLSRIVNLMLFVLPVLAVLGIVGCYLISGHLLKPIRKITCSAESISGGNDLSKRIEPEQVHDELYVLSEAFNNMFNRLEKSFEEEKQFTSDIAHELRTPVSTILAQSELTLSKQRTEEEYIKSLNVIKRQSLRMKNIVEEMLQFSRLEKLKEVPNAKEFNLSSLIENIKEEQMTRNVRSIKIQSDIESNIILNGNSDMICQLVNNLISNAFKYGRDEGNILLSLKQNDNEILLSVQDDGIGIEKSMQDKIFNRFYQADNARTVKDSGCSIGLGLSIALHIAKLHGGYITVESEINKGSIFTFVIPKNI
ncbi:MAG: HAMP domain-containing histidine kinase [Acetobacter sp.]|nr:HAMP domain-containing histidine kinase [Bacteroides sp.]MCM1341309.1 HAMP domain-containing histidine kinase [Acetobacter sp.]MCM1433915.1 HAMP domain-containing histidine kinase [Clostridiales bacterium]